MRRRELERWFDRFRSKGDLRALEKVFDKTARDLLSVAQHLVGDVHDAEDLVQATFVTAIERASTFDRSRELRPWLCGILAHKAAAQWRTDARRPKGVEVHDASGERPVVLRPLGDPSLPLVTTELEGEVSGAIDRMPGPYAAVLRPLLCEGKRAEQIARELGEAPGTVRMRIHRGLVRLRAMLPAGLTAGLAWTTLAPRGLSAVKGAILEHAGASAAVSVAGLGSASVVSGGLVMAKNTGAWVAGAAVLMLGVGITVQQVGLGETGGVQALPGHEEPSVELAGRPAVLDGVDGGVAAKAEESPVDPAESARESASLSSAFLEGRVHGLHPDDVAGVEVVIKWEPPTPLIDLAGHMRDQVYRDALDYGLQGGNVIQPQVLYVPEPVVIDPEPVMINSPQAVRSLTRNATGNPVQFDDLGRVDESEIGAEVFQPGSTLTATLDREGRFRVDLSPWLAAMGEDAIPPAYSVRTRHPLYYDGDGRVALVADELERFHGGEEVVLSTELEMEPACILSGRVESEEPDWTLPALTASTSRGTVDLGALMVPSEAPEPALLTFVVHAYTAERAGLMSGVTLDVSNNFLVRWNQDSCALFEMEGGAPMPEPVTTGTLDGDGSFRMKVREPGEYLLCVMKGDKRPLTFPVTLESRVERVLEEALTVNPGEDAKGVVDDFGLKPEGGIGVTARRTPESGDLPVTWSHYGLVWSGNAFERIEGYATSDEDGGFVIVGLGPGRHQLSLGDAADVNTEGSTAKAGANLEVRLPNDHVRLELQASMLELELYVDGIRTRLESSEEGKGDEGRSLPEARILLIALGEGEDDDQIVGEGMFNDDGRLRALVEPGKNYGIDVIAEGYGCARIVIQAPHAGQRETLSARLETVER